MSTVHNKPVSIDGKVFKRRGAWFGVYNFAFPGTEPALYLGTLHGMAALAPDKNRLINIAVTYNGERVPYTTSARPAELTLSTPDGDVRFTFAGTAQIIAEGDPGMGLMFEKTMVEHESVHVRKDGAWEAFFRYTCSMIFKGLGGSGFAFDDGHGSAPWDWKHLTSGYVSGKTSPAPDGTFTLVLEESTFDGQVRGIYPTYAEAKASMQADWNEFIGKMPAFSGAYEDKREECEYTLWSFLTDPYGSARYPMILMFASNIASQWQMCQNAVALMEHTGFAVDLMLGPIDKQNALGQLPDMYDDAMCESLMLKPPMHGWAVLQIMKRHDLLKEVPRDKLEMLYGGMCRWGDWFLTCRDEDGDGLPSNWHSDETGFDASSLFREHIKLTTPDLAAYLVLLFEACGELAKLLGKADADIWFNKSRTMLAKLVDKLWDGSRFVALDPETGEKVVSDNLIHYMPAILGDRLPKDILGKLVADLSDTSRFFTEWGFASEALTSEYYDKMAFGCGSVLPPAMLYIITGLWDTEHRDFARRVAENYCTALYKDNFPFFIDAKTGEGLYYGCSWSNCAYTILAKMISEG